MPSDPAPSPKPAHPLPELPAERRLWDDIVPGGCHWSGLVRRGQVLRLTALGDGANAALLAFNAEDKLERYNMPDTLKAQHTAFLTAGHVAYSDMGRVLFSVTADSLGWHDTWCGVGDAAMLEAKVGEPHRFDTHRNAMHRNGRDGLLIELAKHGLGPRDLVPTLNLFSKVVPDDEGALRFVVDHAREGDGVDLRFEMTALVVLSTAPHPLDPKTVYDPAPVRLSAWRAAPVAADDPCRTSCPQNERGFLNTERHVA